jgi:alpha-galactosidase
MPPKSSHVAVILWVYCLANSEARQLPGGLGLKPPLAYSTWNFFEYHQNESLTLQIADALISTGLAELGFRYVNMDAGVWHNERDPITHKLVPNQRNWPRGLRYVADQLHDKVSITLSAHLGAANSP